MKLGILTFHCAHNYGAVLQTYGLQEYLSFLGHEVYVIDYRPEYFRRIYNRKHPSVFSTNPIRLLKNIIRELQTSSIRDQRFDGFEKFISNKLHLYPYKEKMDFHEFDAIFLGSDQIWNAEITGGSFDPVYFGVGAKCKVISYAASNKSSNLTEIEAAYYKSALENIDNISVRETTLQRLLSPLSVKQISVTIDPTLLAGMRLMDTATHANTVSKPYVLVYELGPHKEVRQAAEAMAKEINGQVIELTNIIRPDKLGKSDQTATPEDFLSYIKYARIVFATSFHGTALSVLYHKNFYYFRQHSNLDLRIESLLNQLGLSSRIVEMADVLQDMPIDYRDVDDRIIELQHDSAMFIEQALKQSL